MVGDEVGDEGVGEVAVGVSLARGKTRRWAKIWRWMVGWWETEEERARVDVVVVVIGGGGDDTLTKWGEIGTRTG